MKNILSLFRTFNLNNRRKLTYPLLGLYFVALFVHLFVDNGYTQMLLLITSVLFASSVLFIIFVDWANSRKEDGIKYKGELMRLIQFELSKKNGVSEDKSEYLRQLEMKAKRIGYDFLHNHMTLERGYKLPFKYVIIDRSDWREVVDFLTNHPEYILEMIRENERGSKLEYVTAIELEGNKNVDFGQQQLYVKMERNKHYIVIPLLPEEQQIGFMNWVKDKTRPIIPSEGENSNKCAYTYDYKSWLNFNLNGGDQSTINI